MKSELLMIIEAGLKKNSAKVKNYANLLAGNYESIDPKFSKEIIKIINNNSSHGVYFDEFLTKPKDKDSSLDMVEISIDTNYHEGIILEPRIKDAITNFCLAVTKKEELLKHNLDLPHSLLLYGEPGTGKTAIAHLVSKELNLPLVTVKLDGLISSLLGNTAKNIRRVFEYASDKPCILFLDEFDAIAKVRSDSSELGELKRVVNSLLQNIDLFTKGNILIAATNHEKLLDPAIWRRFTTIVETTNISLETKFDIFESSFNNFSLDFSFTEAKRKTIENLIKPLTPSEIRKIALTTIRRVILKGDSKVSYVNILHEFYNTIVLLQETSFIIFLNDNKVSKNEISNYLNVSVRQIDNELKRRNNEREQYN